MKKLIALVLALMMSALIFVSCGPDEDPSGDLPPAGDNGGVLPPAPGSDNAKPDQNWDLLS